MNIFQDVFRFFPRSGDECALNGIIELCSYKKFNGNGIFLFVITKIIHNSREIMLKSINLVYEVVTITILLKKKRK